MTQIDFSGVFPAMVTPFTEDNEIDTETLREDAQRLEAAGVDGLVPMGSTGESATLSHAEHVEVVEAVVDAVEDVPVIAGTGSNNTIEALDLSQQAADAGADALLLISPYYNKPEPQGMYDHYAEIAEAVDLPQIIYNVPSRTGRNIAVDTAVDLADHPNIAGYKAASGDLNRISEVIERTRNKEFAVLSGDDGMTLPILAAGRRRRDQRRRQRRTRTSLCDGRRGPRRRLRVRSCDPPRTRAAHPPAVRREQPDPGQSRDGDAWLRTRAYPLAADRTLRGTPRGTAGAAR
jgi:dihydrodipicolinate synthase (EC 4.2.1.52)